ncbi:MAG: hypothetical protein ACO1TE_21375 [Prosthecobacter sp.]
MKKLAILAIFFTAVAAFFLAQVGGPRRWAHHRASPAVEALRQKTSRFRKEAASLSATDAAKGWAALVDDYLAIPQEQFSWGFLVGGAGRFQDSRRSTAAHISLG